MNESSPDRPPTASRLVRPPSDRYGAPPITPDTDPPPNGSVVRAVTWSIPAAIVALAIHVGLAGPLAFSSSLVIVAIFAGRVIGLSARAGGGTMVTSNQSVAVALVVTGGWLAGAQVATWLYALNEGGVLPLFDYLAQTFGPIVPLAGLAAGLAAWWSAR